MENVKASAKKFMINYGVLLGIISIVFNVILYVTNNFLNPHWSLGLLSFLISIVIIVSAFKAFKKENGGFMKLGQAIKIGLGIALIAGLIGAVWTVLLTTVLEPNYSELMMDVIRDRTLEAAPDITDEQLEQSLSFQEPFTKVSFIAPIGIIFSLFFGFIISLITGLIMKKENPFEDA